MDYLKMLETSYKIEQEEDQYLSRGTYICENILGVFTYEYKLSEEFGKKFVEICSLISRREVFEYIEREDNERWYLIMVNFPFFSNRIEWGTSIRAAWWADSSNGDMNLESSGLYDEKGEQILNIIFDGREWSLFIAAMSEFLNQPNER